MPRHPGDLGCRLPLPQGQRAVEFWERNLLHPFYVYVIQEAGGGPVKIGRARHPLERLAELQCGNPRALVLQSALIAKPEAETRLHKAFRFCRVSGEWFGGGFEQVIVTAAQHASTRQIDSYAAGASLTQVMDWAAELVASPQEVAA